MKSAQWIGQMNDIVKDFKAIRQEYAYDPSVMSTDDPRVAKLKYIIENRLSAVDRIIILLYCETRSYRKLGERMQLSHTTMRKEVLRIKKIIMEEYNR